MSRAEELRKELAEIEKAEKLAHELREKACIKAANEFTHNQANYEYQTKAVAHWPWHMQRSDYGRIIPGVNIQKRLKPELVEAFLAQWPGCSICPDSTQQWRGMTYIRTRENVLYHTGRGTYVINQPVICSNKQWADLVNGIIPKEWLELETTN